MIKKVAVIGGGVAGLTAGIYLCRAGVACTIFERNMFSGGNLTGWNREDYHIDNCIHWLTGTSPSSKTHGIWLDTGALGGVPVLQSEKFFSSVLGGERATLWCDLARTREELCRLSPVDASEINRFLLSVRSLMPGGFRSVGVSKAVPAFLHYARRNLYAAAAAFHHPLLRTMMTDYVGGPFSALGLIIPYADVASGNGGIPEGGSRAMAKRMEERFLSLGGDLRLGTGIKEIVLSGGKATGVMTEAGEYVSADAVVAAADPSVTFGRLLPPCYTPRWWTSAERDDVHSRFSSVHAAFSCNTSDLPFSGTEVIPMRKLRFDTDCFCRLPVREYSSQTTYAPAGKTVLQTLLFTREAISHAFVRLGLAEKGYDDVKDAVGRGLAERLTEAYPSLSSSLKVLDVWTPYTYNRYFGSTAGAFMAYALTPENLLDRFPMRIPGLSNVLLATQWLRSPGGLPIAAQSGKRAADFLILRRKFLF